MNVKHWVYDLETLVNCFIGVFESYAGTERKVFVIHPLKNDLDEFLVFLDQCKKNKTWMFGFNNIAFDAQILEHIMRNRSTLKGKSAEEVTGFIYAYAQKTIEKSNSGDFSDYPEWKLSMPQVDIFKLNHWDSEAKKCGLKWVQYSMDWYNVEEMPHPHHKPVNGMDALNKVIAYCINDVSSTKAIFQQDDMKKQIKLRAKLSKEYGLNLYSASEPRISKEMFIHFLSEKLGTDKKSIKGLRTVRDSVNVNELILPYIGFTTPPFVNMLCWFKKMNIRITEGKMKGPQHIMKAYGVDTVYALGGIHGCTKPGIYKSDETHVIVTADVTSFYPNLAIRNGWSPAHIPQEQFCELYEWFFEERKKYSKKDPLNYLFKIILNSTYGLSKNKHSFLYDPELTFRITVNGQLLLSKLYEMVMLAIPDAQPIMQNTDGLEFRMCKKDQEVFERVCKEWEILTSLQLECDTYEKMIIADVNNYIAVYGKGKEPKCKGRFEWKDLALHKNKSFLVVSKALYEYFVNGIKPEDYLESNQNIFDYCGGAKIRGEWYFVQRHILNGEYKEEKLQKLVRYYISENGVKLFKCNPDGREIQLESGHWLQTVFNRHLEQPFEKYRIDKRYYLDQIYQEIANIEGTKASQAQTSLFQ
jgi:hypothetical protein